jgi:hypothetical protein
MGPGPCKALKPARQSFKALKALKKTLTDNQGLKGLLIKALEAPKKALKVQVQDQEV